MINSYSPHYILGALDDLFAIFLFVVIVRTICLERNERRGSWRVYVVYEFVRMFFPIYLVYAVCKGYEAYQIRLIVNVLYYLTLAFTTVWMLRRYYRDSEFSFLVCFLLLTILQSTAEWMSVSTVDFFFGDPYSEQNGLYYLSSNFYYFDYLFLLLIAGVFGFLMRNNQSPINGKNFCVILIGLLPAGVLWCRQLVTISTQGAWRMDHTDWAIGIGLSVVFVMQFLSLQNYFYLAAQKKIDDLRISQLERQYDYYRSLQENEERVRSIYHDMKNHLLLMEHRSTEGARVQRMVDQIRSQIEEYEDFIQTGNDFLNVVMREKAARAREEQIDFLVIANLGDSGFIEAIDISTIFGNALDNAIEASGKLPEDKRMISFRGNRLQDALVIRIDNNAPDTAGWSTQAGVRRTDKKDAGLHGFGLSNMRKAVGKYGGTMRYGLEKGRFFVKIMIPIPQTENHDAAY